MLSMRKRMSHSKLLKILEWIVVEVPEPRVFFVRQARRHAQLILVDFPRNAQFLEPLGERHPSRLLAVPDVFIQHMGFSITGLSLPNRSSPQMQSIWRCSSQR